MQSHLRTFHTFIVRASFVATSQILVFSRARAVDGVQSLAGDAKTLPEELFTWQGDTLRILDGESKKIICTQNEKRSVGV